MLFPYLMRAKLVRSFVMGELSPSSKMILACSNEAKMDLLMVRDDVRLEFFDGAVLVLCPTLEPFSPGNVKTLNPKPTNITRCIVQILYGLSTCLFVKRLYDDETQYFIFSTVLRPRQDKTSQSQPCSGKSMLSSKTSCEILVMILTKGLVANWTQQRRTDHGMNRSSFKGNVLIAVIGHFGRPAAKNVRWILISPSTPLDAKEQSIQHLNRTV